MLEYFTLNSLDFKVNLLLDQVEELRHYFNEKGAEISVERSNKGLEDDLHKIIGVCDSTFNSTDVQEKEVESSLNSIVSVLMVVSLCNCMMSFVLGVSGIISCLLNFKYSIYGTMNSSVWWIQCKIWILSQLYLLLSFLTWAMCFNLPSKWIGWFIVFLLSIIKYIINTSLIKMLPMLNTNNFGDNIYVSLIYAMILNFNSDFCCLRNCRNTAFYENCYNVWDMLER